MQSMKKWMDAAIFFKFSIQIPIPIHWFFLLGIAIPIPIPILELQFCESTHELGQLPISDINLIRSFVIIARWANIKQINESLAKLFWKLSFKNGYIVYY